MEASVNEILVLGLVAAEGETGRGDRLGFLSLICDTTIHLKAGSYLVAVRTIGDTSTARYPEQVSDVLDAWWSNSRLKILTRERRGSSHGSDETTSLSNAVQERDDRWHFMTASKDKFWHFVLCSARSLSNTIHKAFVIVFLCLFELIHPAFDSRTTEISYVLETRRCVHHYMRVLLGNSDVQSGGLVPGNISAGYKTSHVRTLFWRRESLTFFLFHWQDCGLKQKTSRWSFLSKPIGI